MFGLFKKKIKEAVDKLSGRIEEETEEKENVFQKEEEKEHTAEDTGLEPEIRGVELRSEETEREVGREIASPGEARSILSLDPNKKDRVLK